MGGRAVRVAAPAKVNLFLEVLAREASGFHQLQTLFCALEFGDSLLVRLGGSGISLEIDGPSPGPKEENLAYRAAKGFLAASGTEVGLEIHLTKRIPVQGGLGGGSSDAAATLKALSALLPGRVAEADLLELAGGLGSDVPFFLCPSPLALAWGRGDRLLPLPSLPRAAVLLAVPPVGVATPEAYRLLARARAEGPPTPGPGVFDLGGFGDWRAIGAAARNDFEAPVLRAFPLLGRLRTALAETGPILSLLSGSGSALFAVFAEREMAERAEEALRSLFPDSRFMLTESRAESPDPIVVAGVEP